MDLICFKRKQKGQNPVADWTRSMEEREEEGWAPEFLA